MSDALVGHVLHVIESLEHGGAERVLLSLAAAQSRQQRVSVACLKRYGPLAERLPEEVELFCLRKGEGDDPRVVLRLGRALRRRGVDVVHAHAWGVLPEAGVAARIAGARLVFTAHGPYLPEARGRLASLRRRLRARLERRLLRSAQVVAVSESIAHEIAQRTGVAEQRVVVVRNGIAPGPEPLPRGGPVRRLVSVGRLAPIKDQALMIEALSLLAQRFPQLELELVGDGPQRESLRRLARRRGLAGRVRFAGFREDVEQVLAGADLFLLSSRHEGISMALLEAMRAGLPIVATDVGGVRETIVDGSSGVLVRAGDARAFAGAIELLVCSPSERRRLGEGARRRLVQEFSDGAMLAGYARVYAQARTAGAGSRRPPRRGRRPYQWAPQPGRGSAARPPRTPARLQGGAGSLRILVHHRTQGRGAEGVHLASMVRQLRQLGHRVDVLSPPGVDPLTTAGAAPVDKSARVRTRGVRTLWKWISRHLPGVLFELGEIAYNLPAAVRLSRALEAGYDLVYERYAFYLVAGAWVAGRRGIPFVLEANELSGLAERARPQRLPRLCGAFERFLLARCGAVVVVSSTLRAMALAQGVDPRRVTVVPNAVEEAALAPPARDPALVQRYGLSGRRVIGFAGWFDAWDRLDLLVQAVRRLRPAHPDLVALLIGDGPGARALREQIARLGLAGHVLLTGPVPRAQMHRHLALLDVAVLPHSNRFGSPMVMFEMMACRLPLVAPRLPPIEDVHEHGRTALLFEPLDGDGLVAALDRLLRDPALGRALAERAFARLRRRHTWRRNAERILAAAGRATAAAAPTEGLRRAG